MKISFDSIKPIYIQIAEGIEDDIVEGRLLEGSPAYSQLIIAKELDVNPATAAKGINLLVQKGILIKQRGLPMTVAKGAREELMKNKLDSKVRELANELALEANKIDIEREKLLDIVCEAINHYEQL